ncbi:MAG: prepilin-type N-terminal cleavage/methylation domain-containing protein [Campylobacterales bacterium]|nr:prepilin-type N-terminal cleavage/methylation domain-containing protein [Campylobacterales bacterium]
MFNINDSSNRYAFTMIELVFVIVVLGILAAIAVPKLAATRDDAQIAKGRSDVASIRSAIVSERQSRLLKGQSSYINKLHNSDKIFFDGNGTAATDGKLLMYGITPKIADGHWHTAACDGTPPNSVCTYKFKVMGVDHTFTYTQATGTFVCTSGTYCSQLTD